MGSKVVENIKKRLLNKLSNPPKNDYFDNWEDNILDDIDKNLVELDLTDGSGNELNKKFKAIHSSSALCVNNFGIFKDKELIKDFKIIGETEFINSILFEEKLATGLQGTKPNLDAYLENLNSIIGIESKFTEYFVKKKASFEPSYNKENLGYLPNEVFDLIEKYSNKTGYLDVAQLLKHSIGLINKVINSPEKKVKLLYIYWTPIEEIQLCKKHSDELEIFKQDMSKISQIDFYSMTYQELWNENIKTQFHDHFEKVKAKYRI